MRIITFLRNWRKRNSLLKEIEALERSSFEYYCIAKSARSSLVQTDELIRSLQSNAKNADQASINFYISLASNHLWFYQRQYEYHYLMYLEAQKDIKYLKSELEKL